MMKFCIVPGLEKPKCISPYPSGCHLLKTDVVLRHIISSTGNCNPKFFSNLEHSLHSAWNHFWSQYKLLLAISCPTNRIKTMSFWYRGHLDCRVANISLHVTNCQKIDSEQLAMAKYLLRTKRQPGESDECFWRRRKLTRNGTASAAVSKWKWSLQLKHQQKKYLGHAARWCSGIAWRTNVLRLPPIINLTKKRLAEVFGRENMVKRMRTRNYKGYVHRKFAWLRETLDTPTDTNIDALYSELILT